MSWQGRNECETGAWCAVQTCATFALERDWEKNPWSEAESRIETTPEHSSQVPPQQGAESCCLEGP